MKTFNNCNSAYTIIEQTLRETGEFDENIKLNCNEMPFKIPTYLKKELSNKMMELAWNRYPDLQQKELAGLIAESVDLQTENIILGNGSSQLIQQIINCCSKFISTAIIENPTFSLYHQFCKNERMTIREWRLNQDGCFDLTNFPKINEAAIVIITSPNNPTGTVLATSELKKLLIENPSCIFIVDEAYGEYAEESAVSLINQYSNLLILKTFSKGLGLPSIRFGYVLGATVLINQLKKFTVPFTINVFTELIVRESLTNSRLINVIKVYQERTKNLRDFVYYLLSDMADENFKVYQSASNFIFIKVEEPNLLNQIKQNLKSRNIVVSYPTSDGIRITIGNEIEMDKVLRVFKNTIKSYKGGLRLMLETII